MRTLSSRLVRDARRSQHTDDFNVDSSWSQSRVTCEISGMTDGENLELEKRVNKFTVLAEVEEGRGIMHWRAAGGFLIVGSLRGLAPRVMDSRLRHGAQQSRLD